MNDKVEEEIREGERVARFLADDAVKGAIQRLTDGYIAKWKTATEPAEREALWSKVRVVEDLQIELQAIVGNGIQARVNRERTDRRQNRKG